MISEEIVKLRKELEKEGINGISLDIDETLSWTNGCWFKKMQRLFGNPEGLSVNELVSKYRYA